MAIMKVDVDSARKLWRDAKTMYDEVVTYNGLIVTGQFTWDDLLDALGRAQINAEDAAFRLHMYLGLPKRDGKVIIDRKFWFAELADRKIPVASVARKLI